MLLQEGLLVVKYELGASFVNDDPGYGLTGTADERHVKCGHTVLEVEYRPPSVGRRLSEVPGLHGRRASCRTP
ncbi:hypothetical protein TNCT_470861 [Trichonephila clavata]|uniref:Uncharacterized protein n=1 Tax=Trichonephila clavata TaxID=2740835 RepID=A0A8X6IX56_TRICU|nr:hypothetical protein TNCT_470861 [Trichonephila clavata]